MLKIREIQIRNFRAFSGPTTTINLTKGENLIVFGENGSGKSSLFYAIKNFFESIPKSLPINEHPYKNFFAKENADVFVKLKLLRPPADLTSPPAVPARALQLDYQWTNRVNDSGNLARQGLDVTKGFIDYKNLLETYFVQQASETVNLFKFLLEDTLTDVRMIDGTQTYGEAWSAIKQKHAQIIQLQKEIDAAPDKRRMRAQRKAIATHEEEIKAALELLNSDLIFLLPDLIRHANNILRDFRMNIALELDYSLARYEPGARRKSSDIKAKEIILHIDFYDQRRAKHHHFLNEARLSAIAVSLYFASFLVNPQAGIKLLVLDDLLIGLDMANRLPVLDILEKHFPDFQIFIFTFDKFWYQALQYRFPLWNTIEFFPLKSEGNESPALRHPSTFLAKAKSQSRAHNYESAANFLRSFYEEIIKDFCAHHRLKVPFHLEPGRLNASEFWKAILDKDNPNKPSASIMSRVETVVKTILNPLSHAANVPMTGDEIRLAIDVIEELDRELKALKV